MVIRTELQSLVEDMLGAISTAVVICCGPDLTLLLVLIIADEASHSLSHDYHVLQRNP